MTIFESNLLFFDLCHKSIVPMQIFGLLFAIVLLEGINAQNSLLFTSNWTGTITDITPVLALLFNNYACKVNPITYNSYFVTPGLTFLSPINSMNTESTRLSNANIKYLIGESNKFLNFIVNLTNTKEILNIYPNDAQILSVVIAVVNRVYNPSQPKQGIVVILKMSNEVNNLNVGNYKNIIIRINQLGWSNVLFLDYKSAENVVFQLRLNSYYNIISLLTDPSDNRDLIRKAFMANLMVWRYQWIIVNLLGEYNSLIGQTQFGNGVLTNNVTVITFADPLTGNTGREVLLSESLKIVRELDCSTNAALTTFSTSGLLSIVDNSRTNFLFAVYRNPGTQVASASHIGLGVTAQAGLVTLPDNLTYVPFVMNYQTSLSSSQKQPLRIGFVNFPPFSYMVGGNYTGFVMDMLVTILRQLNISYTIVDLSAQYNGLNTGTLNTNNLTYTQLLGLVQNNVVDTLSFLFIINRTMMSYFDFSVPILPGHISVLYMNRTYTGLNALITYVVPFDWSVWVMCLGSAVAVAITLTFSDFIFPDKYARYRLLMSLFFSISSLTHGAYFDPPRKFGGIIIMSFWWLFCLVIVIIWACNYAAFLAKYRHSQQLTTVFSLLNQNVYSYGTLNDDLLNSFLSQNNQSDPQSMLQILNEDMLNGTVTDFDTAVNLVSNTNYAFIYADRVVTYLRNKNCLDMFGNWMGFEYGLVLPKNSEKTLAINNAIVLNRANGVIDQLANTYWPEYNNDCLSKNLIDVMTRTLQSIMPNHITESLAFNVMIGIFVIIVAGSVCCLVLAMIERFIRKLIQMRKDKHAKYEYDATVEELSRF